MSSWTNVYNNKKRSVEEAILSLPKRCTVVVGLAAMEAQGLLSNLHKFRDNFEYIKVLTCLNMKDYPFISSKESEGILENHTWFMSVPTRNARDAGLKTVDYIPNNLHMSSTDKFVSEKEEGNKIVFWGTVTPMNEVSGFMSLGLSNVYEMDILEKADYTVLEVNDKVPWTHGETQVHISQADVVTESSWTIPDLSVVEPAQTEIQIAQYIADLVRDGSTVQIGIGGIPNAVAKLLKNKKDLGIHTEMFTESMIELFEDGIINNSKKSLWRGKFVCAFALGSQNMYRWIDNNPGVWIMRGSYVNDPFVIAKNDNMVSINTAIAVDLTGQVCSESLGAKQFSGSGGQLDTHRGAVKSKDGKGIIALRATAKKGTLSTIVPMHSPGSVVTVPRHDVDYVVTEFGVAHLRGKSVAQRVKALVNIAHPDFREQLLKQSYDLGYL